MSVRYNGIACRPGVRLPGAKPTTTSSAKNVKGIVVQTPVTATVEYVHPKGRFITVRYSFSHGGSFPECINLDRTEGG